MDLCARGALQKSGALPAAKASRFPEALASPRACCAILLCLSTAPAAPLSPRLPRVPRHRAFFRAFLRCFSVAHAGRRRNARETNVRGAAACAATEQRGERRGAGKRKRGASGAQRERRAEEATKRACGFVGARERGAEKRQKEQRGKGSAGGEEERRRKEKKKKETWRDVEVVRIVRRRSGVGVVRKPGSWWAWWRVEGRLSVSDARASGAVSLHSCFSESAPPPPP